MLRSAEERVISRRKKLTFQEKEYFLDLLSQTCLYIKKSFVLIFLELINSSRMALNLQTNR